MGFMAYILIWEKRALKQMRRIPADIQVRITRTVKALADDPRPGGVVKTKGELKGLWRIHVGRSYRVLYGIDDDRLVVTIISVGPRESIY